MMLMRRLGGQGRRHATPRDFLGLWAHVEALTPTDTLHLLAADRSAFFGQRATDTPIAITRIRPRQGHNPLVELLSTIGHGFRRISIGRPGHAQIATGPAHRAQSLSNDMGDGSFSVAQGLPFF